MGLRELATGLEVVAGLFDAVDALSETIGLVIEAVITIIFEK